MNLAPRRVFVAICSLVLLVVAVATLTARTAQPMSPPPTPNIWRVKYTLTGAQNGTSWADSFSFLQSAFLNPMLQDGDEIWVAQGTYTPFNDLVNGYVIPKRVKVYGAFLGNELTLAARGGLATQTILSGLTPGGQAAHIISINNIAGAGGAPGVLLDSLTIQEGNATGFQRGGGIYCVNSDLDLTNCTVKSNAADYEGGGLYFQGPGTGVANTLHVLGCVFEGNRSWYTDGGAIYGSWVKGDMLNVNFQNNSVPGNGGALFLSNMGVGNPFSAADCIFWNNSATGSGSLGGAVYLGSSSMSSSYGANATFINCTMADNSIGSCAAGQAVYLHANAVANSAIYNCILALNNVGNCPVGNPIGEGALATVQYTDCWATAGAAVAHGGTGNIEKDPKFRNHALAGGLTLQVGSFCLDAADYMRVPTDVHDLDGNGITGEKLPLDFLFQRRLVDRPEADTGHSDATPGHTYLDMGAYEKPQ